MQQKRGKYDVKELPQIAIKLFYLSDKVVYIVIENVLLLNRRQNRGSPWNPLVENRWIFLLVELGSAMWKP